MLNQSWKADVKPMRSVRCFHNEKSSPSRNRTFANNLIDIKTKPLTARSLVVKESASGAVDSGLIPSRVTPITLKLVIFSTYLLDAQH